MNPFSQIPAAVRKVAYIVYSLVGVGIGATQVGYVAANNAQPTWLTVALAVMAYLGIALGFTAASNVTPDDDGA